MKTYFTFMAALYFTLGVGMSKPANALETPQYETSRTAIANGNDVEIRNYSPYVVAETVVEADSLDNAGRVGFKRLANYIFGDNRSRTSMDMTSPVGSEKMDMTAPVGAIGESGRYTISFVMSSKYTLGTLPLPNDSQVVLRQIPERKVAAIIFSGFWSQKNFSSHTEELINFLKSERLETVGQPLLARYNMPLTPWFLRHNEIQIELK